MKVSRRNFDRAVSRGAISAEQADGLWRALEERDEGRARFDLPHVAYYFGALVVILAMTYFVTVGWESFGGGGLMAIAFVYAVGFAGVGGWMWRRRDLRVPGGLLVAATVCMTPLAVYGFQEMAGLWLGRDPGDYRDFYQWVSGGWFFMEVATVFVGLVALYFVRFPFITAPVAFTLWFMSMDATPLVLGGDYYEQSGYQWVSIVFGLAMLVGAFVVDRRTEEDYAFWGYLFGMFAFWGGLTLFEGGSEVEWAVYGAINVGLILLSVLLNRRVFIVFGAVGIFGYTGHLAWEIFADSILFPFALSVVGLAVIALGIVYAKNKERIEGAVMKVVPAGRRRALSRR